jgi:hypothetical protein
MAHKKKNVPPQGQPPPTDSDRSPNPPKPDHGPEGRNPSPGFQEQDPKRRLGGFEGEGEHARTGNRGHQ